MANQTSFARVPRLDAACVLLTFETWLIAPNEDTNNCWHECFRLTWLDKYGHKQEYTWHEERQWNNR